MDKTALGNELFPTGSGYSRASQAKTEIHLHSQDTSYIVKVPTSTINLTNTLLRRPWGEKQSTKKPSWGTRTSVKRSALLGREAYAAQLNRRSRLESSMASAFHQHLSQADGEDLRWKWWKHRWCLEMSGSRWSKAHSMRSEGRVCEDGEADGVKFPFIDVPRGPSRSIQSSPRVQSFKQSVEALGRK